MYVKDLMTREVVTISPETPLRAVAETFLAHGISGAPVCDPEGHVLGVISKRDILHKEQGPSYEESRGVLARFRSPNVSPKPDARTAREAMTQPALTVSTFSSVAGAARLMLEKGVSRLPVVSGDTIAGIVTETDLVRVFTRSDEEILREVTDELQWQLVDLHSRGRTCPDVAVTDGAVVVTGEVEKRSDVEVVDHIVRRVPGVVSITLDLAWSVDDRRELSATRF